MNETEIFVDVTQITTARSRVSDREIPRGSLLRIMKRWRITIYRSPKSNRFVRSGGRVIFRQVIRGSMTQARDTADAALRRLKHGREIVIRQTHVYDAYGKQQTYVGYGGEW